MRKLALLVTVALTLPTSAVAKLQGDLQLCGSSGCRVIDKHRGHEGWPVLEGLSHGRKVGPVSPRPYYRLRMVDPETRSVSVAFYFMPNGAVTRADDGAGANAWTRLRATPEAVAQGVRELRPFPAPRLVRVVVGSGRLAKDPNSYLRLFRIPRSTEIIPDPAGRRPQAGVRETVTHARRVKRHWIPVYLWSARESPWSDFRTSVYVGRRLDLVKRDGEIVRIPHALAERVRHGESLR